MGGTNLQYVEKSKVLGVTIDENLTFSHHAKAVLKSCWYAWYQVSDKTTRKRGLNTSSLSILFKTIVLTKLLYASPIWLDKNLDIFKDFMSKVLLRITGAQFHPTKELKEVLVGIPPLKLLQEQITIKFMLKCLSQGDDVAGRILQVEGSPSHPFYNHTRLTKEFLQHVNGLDSRLSRISLTMFDKDQFVYTKEKILEYTCMKWDSHLKENFTNIRKDDPFNLEPLQSDEYLFGFINCLNLFKEPLFKRHDKRMENTNLTDFLHGHSLRFQDFTYSVLKANKDVHVPLCLECTTNPDSPHHQLFECPNLQSEARSSLAMSIGSLETNFHLPIIFHTGISRATNMTILENGAISPACSICETRKDFKKLVQYVCEQSDFQDELLSR